MSTSAILPVSSIDFGSTTATASQQTVFNNLLSQLQQAIGAGDLTTTQTLLNAIDAISPSSATGSTPLATFLTSLNTALNDSSVTEAQAALATYQSATPSTAAATTQPAIPTASAPKIAADLVQSELKLNLVTTLLSPNSTVGSDGAATPASNPNASLLDILNAAYSSNPAATSSTASAASASPGATATSSSRAGSADNGTSPYDTLVASIQASLAAGDGTLTPALAYLQASGNFVNTSA